MKIAWQAYDRLNYTGGPIINTIRLLPAFKALGHEVFAIIGHDGSGHTNADYLDEQGIKVYKYPKPKHSEPHVKLILQFIKEIKPDVFVSNISAQAGFAGRWIQKWGIPVIHTHRSDDPLNNGTAQFFFGEDEKWRLSVLVCVNSFLYEKVQATTKEKIEKYIIPSGVPLSQVKANQDFTNKLKIVYAGRFVQRQKRILDTVNAFINLALEEDNLEFTLIGSGDDTILSEIRSKITDKRLTNQIKIKGKLTGDDYKKELARHHIMVLLSDYEGTPGSIMDGMSCGLVPIATKIDGISDLIKHGHNGILIENRDQSFVDAIFKLKNDDNFRRKLSENAVKTIEEDFSLESAVDKWNKLFHNLTDRNKVVNKNVKIPNRIVLPKNNPLLVEHISKTPPTLTFRIKSKLKKVIDAIR